MLRRSWRNVLVASVMLACVDVRAVGAVCSVDVLCANDCRADICGPDDPDGPKAFYAACTDDCVESQSNCANWVECMKGCVEDRDELRGLCTDQRRSCIRHKCRVCTTGGGASAAPLLTPCVQNCRTANKECHRGAKSRARACRRLCRQKCSLFHKAVEACLGKCGDGSGDNCDDKLEMCEERCGG